MRLPRFRLRTLMAVVVGVGIALATMRAYPAIWASFLIVCVMFAVSAAVVLLVMAVALGITACVGAAAKVVDLARSDSSAGRRQGDSVRPGSG